MDKLICDKLIPSLKVGSTPNEYEIKKILELSQPILVAEPNIVEISPPIVIGGDSHGQLTDVVNLFDDLGYPSNTRYLFLGDYVDRGAFSLELICLLLCLKIKYPNDFFLLRGNHETRAVNREYGFQSELIEKGFGMDIWNSFNNVFDCFPIAAIVDKRLFCVHGGLDPNAVKVETIRTLERKVEPELTSPLAGLLWSDPAPDDDRTQTWKRNLRRAGYLFTEEHVDDFLKTNGLQKIVRSHEMADGYRLLLGDKVINIWCAPNYIGEENGAAVLIISESSQEQFWVYQQRE